MGRRKIEIKAIKDDRNRSVTFLKRKGGLFKKAHELSVLCSVDVAVIIFGHNKKLYEFSSGDINEIIGRYQYYGNAHEHKGPGDFNGGKDGDDDDDEDMPSPPPESHSSQDHPMLPHQLQDQPNYQHMRHHTPSASPPVANGIPYHPRHGTPQPQQTISRPSSRTAGRRTSSNLIPQQHPQQHPQQYSQAHPHAHAHAHIPHTSQAQGPPNHNGMAYLPTAPIAYNPQTGAGMPMQPESTQAAPYHSYPAQAAPLSQPPQVYLTEQQRRPSVPPGFPQDRPPPVEENSPPQPPPMQQGLMPEPKRSVKARSIWTPVDDGNSFLAKHWGTRTTSNDQQSGDEPSHKEEVAIKSEQSNRAQSVDVASVSRINSSNTGGPGPPPPRSGRHPAHTRGNTSMSSLPEIAPPQRSNSAQWASAQGAKRPQLKVQIPDEPSDGGSAEADSSPRGSSGTAGGGPSTKGAGTEGSHSSGVVLPPPSPSASALLSAGAQGPPNPFARPNPPTSAAPNNNIETPISALPSRFMADGLLPSPSSFYPEWGFGRTGGESNLLLSPLNFQTPVMPNGPSFLREDPESMKRKSPEGEGSDSGTTKRMKT